MDFTKTQNITIPPQTHQKRRNRLCAAWRVFIVAKQFIVEPRKLGQTRWVAWRLFIITKLFLGRNLEIQKN